MRGRSRRWQHPAAVTGAGKKKRGSASASGMAAPGAAGEEEEEEDLPVEQRTGDCREGGRDWEHKQSDGAAESVGRGSRGSG